MATGDIKCAVCGFYLSWHEGGQPCLDTLRRTIIFPKPETLTAGHAMDPMEEDARKAERTRIISEAEAKLNSKMREALCTLLGLSPAVSNWEIVEAVEVLYKPVKDLAVRERTIAAAEAKLAELHEAEKNKITLVFEPGFYSLLCQHLNWSTAFVGYHGEMARRLYKEIMRQGGVNIIYDDPPTPEPTKSGFWSFLRRGKNND